MDAGVDRRTLLEAAKRPLPLSPDRQIGGSATGPVDPKGPMPLKLEPRAGHICSRS